MTSTAVAVPRSTALGPAWDAFQLMDRLDEQALVREMEGIAVRELIYVVKDGKEEVEGLSKVGVDECCRMLVRDGQVVRETDLRFELIGEGERQQAVFTAKAARFALNPTSGQEMKLDEVIGVKRQAMYEERAPLTLDSRVPGKKWRDKTFREILDDKDGRNYLAWMADNFKEEHIRDFARKVLDGEDVTEMAAGSRFNPHWYEHGAMKACRNARIRLIPLNVRAQVIALAKQEGRAKVVDRSGEELNGDGGESTREEKRIPVFPYMRKHGEIELKDAPLTQRHESGDHLIPDEILTEALEWAHKVIEGKGKRKLEKEADRARFATLVSDLRAELARREAERKMTTSEGEQRPDPTNAPSDTAPPTSPGSTPQKTSSSSEKATTPNGAPGTAKPAPDPAAHPLKFRANVTDEGRIALEALENTDPAEASVYQMGHVIRDAITMGPFTEDERNTLKQLFVAAGMSTKKLGAVRASVLKVAEDLPF